MDTDQRDIDNQAALFSILGDPTRLKLLKLLVKQKESQSMCVNALANHLGITQSAVSQHIRILKSADLVQGKRAGYRIHYFVNRDALLGLKQQLSGVFDVGEESTPNGDSE